MTHQVGPKQRKGNDKERIQTKYPSPPLAKGPFAKPVIRQQRKGLQWRKLGLPASTLMFKTPWRIPVTMNKARAAEHCCCCTFRLLGYSFSMWREYWLYQYGHSKIIYRYRYQWLCTKFRQRHVNLPKLWHGNVWNSDRGHKDPP